MIYVFCDSQPRQICGSRAGRMNLCCPCRSVAPGRQVLDYVPRGTVGAGRLPSTRHARIRQAGPRAPQTPGSLALAAVALYKTFSAPSRCLGHHVCAGGVGCLAALFERLKVMSLSGSNDRPVPDGGNPILSAGPRNAAARQRLAKALRANLGRRKAQKRERRKQSGDPAESKTAQGEGTQNRAGTKQD
jgi:hypothetical protein